MSRSLDGARGRTAARAVVERFGLRDPSEIDVEGIAGVYGAEIVEGELRGAVARLVRIAAQSRIRLSTLMTEAGMRRFSIAHELGHLILNHASRGISLCHELAAGGDCLDNKAEAEANGFAAELLMPESLVTMFIGGLRPNLELAERVATVFNASLPASAIRIIELTEAPCAVVYAEDDSIQWSSCSASWQGVLARRGPLPNAALARIARGLPGALRGRTQRDSWNLDTDPARPLIEEVAPVAGTSGHLTVLSESN